jgi:hypothetical protein
LAVLTTAIVCVGPVSAKWLLGVNYAVIVHEEKDPSTWDPIKVCTYLTYAHTGHWFIGSFHGVAPLANTNYSLIYYADPWPGDNPGFFIAKGTSSATGWIRIWFRTFIGYDLPHTSDANYPAGAKIWLVLSDDYDETTNRVIAWNPTQYLFEHELINYTYVP